MKDTEQAEDVDSPAAPRHLKKSSGCGAALVIIGSLALLMVLACGGIIGWFAWSFWPRMTDKPAEVAALSREILDLDIPDDFEPGMAISMDNNFAMSMRMVMYKRRDNRGSLMLGNFRMKMSAPGQKPDLTGNNESLKLKMGDTEMKMVQVREKDVPFRFSAAVEEGTGKKYRVVEGELESEGLTTFLKLVLEDDVYDEDQAIKLIESIR